MVKIIDIAWLAGLLEGEGCFRLDKGKYPIIRLGMGDEDVVVRAASLMKTRVLHCRNMWTTTVAGAYSIISMTSPRLLSFLPQS